MQRIFGIASLIIALILGTCLSSQAQIVTVTPVNIDGGFEIFKNSNPGVVKSKEDQTKTDVSTTNDQINTLQIPVLIGLNEYLIPEYEVNYSICRYSNGGQTDLKSESYYAKFIECRMNDKLNIKINN